jgi:hypothetical protein
MMELRDGCVDNDSSVGTDRIEVLSWIFFGWLLFLLLFGAEGASYIGDEWGATVRAWHLNERVTERPGTDHFIMRDTKSI